MNLAGLQNLSKATSAIHIINIILDSKTRYTVPPDVDSCPLQVDVGNIAGPLGWCL